MRFLVLLISLLIVSQAPAQKVAVGLPAMNVIYVGLKNEVKVAVEGYKNSDLVLLMSPHTHIAQEGETLYIKPVLRGDAYLYVGVKQNKDTLWLDTAHFRVRKIPTPNPQLGTLHDGAVESIGTIKANAIKVFLSLGEGFAMEGLKANIEKFSVVVADSNNIAWIEQTGNKFEQEIGQSLNHLSAPGKIYIYNITYLVTKNGDTARRNSLLEGKCEITARYTPATSQYLVDDEKKQQLIANHRPAFNISGGFYDTNALLVIENGELNMQKIAAFAGKTKHGRWVFTSGVCNPIPYKEEYYDSGRLVRFVGFDSTGFKMADIALPKGADSVYYKEIYPNGGTRREGWVALDLEKYHFYGESNYCAAPRQFAEYYKGLKFVPIGYWKEYYENGALKRDGHFQVFLIAPETAPFSYSLPLVYSDVYLQGTWNEYDEDGNLLHQYKYNKGFY